MLPQDDSISSETRRSAFFCFHGLWRLTLYFDTPEGAALHFMKPLTRSEILDAAAGVVAAAGGKMSR